MLPADCSAAGGRARFARWHRSASLSIGRTHPALAHSAMPTSSPEHLKALIRDVPDFPVEGILFRDVTPLLRDPRALGEVVAAFAERYRDAGIDVVAGIESRGFIFGAPLALELGVGFVPIRKLGKLPAEKIRREYALEYGTNVLEMHADAVRPGERVLVVDDLLATGGTARASVELVEELGATVAGVAFVIELGFLEGRRALPGQEVFSLLTY
jgi:adenine phosphoribosyltransferase